MLRAKEQALLGEVKLSDDKQRLLDEKQKQLDEITRSLQKDLMMEGTDQDTKDAVLDTFSLENDLADLDRILGQLNK